MHIFHITSRMIDYVRKWKFVFIAKALPKLNEPKDKLHFLLASESTLNIKNFRRSYHFRPRRFSLNNNPRFQLTRGT